MYSRKKVTRPREVLKIIKENSHPGSSLPNEITTEMNDDLLLADNLDCVAIFAGTKEDSIHMNKSFAER